MMKIIEQSIIGKRGEATCEDGIVVCDGFVAVVDGSTSKSSLPALACGRSHGQVALDAVRECLLQCDADADMPSFCRDVTDWVRRKYDVLYDEAFVSQCFGGDTLKHMALHPEDRFTCSAIVYSCRRDEVWMIGDCHCLVVDSSANRYYDNPKPMEEVLATRRADKIRQLLAEGMDMEQLRINDIGRSAIIEDLKCSMKAQNKDYAVIDGFEIPLDKVRVIDDVLGTSGEGMELVLASDGYPRLFPTLRETEAYLQSVLLQDPLMIGEHRATKGWHPSATSFDDRTYLRMSM